MCSSRLSIDNGLGIGGTKFDGNNVKEGDNHLRRDGIYWNKNKFNNEETLFTDGDYDSDYDGDDGIVDEVDMVDIVDVVVDDDMVDVGDIAGVVDNG
ncbi:hypothetical protein Glove_86g131 [Diversispora epigaea]|uniref:Uncharacterized protein n=1 Tax=Diversispora epigaea TaxID=1348612 RepID=A0A397J6M4_9GLOM|nr:hypothetical protein Glove_86g131 [Diversispora epigaea]